MTSQLRTLLDGAADPQVPLDLGERALHGARHRRTRRWVAGGTVLAVIALVIGVGVAMQPFRTDAVPRPADVASLPAELPRPAGLPTLAETPMESAAAAYVVGGEVVLVSSATGAAARLDLSTAPDAAGYGALRGVTSVALSPDGRWLLVAWEWPPSVDALGLPLSLVEVGTGTITWVAGLYSAAPQAGGWLQPSVLAWAPDSQRFACTCTAGGRGLLVRLVELADARDGHIAGTVSLPAEAYGLSWGRAGLAVQTEQYWSGWWLVPVGQLEGGGSRSGWQPLHGSLIGLAMAQEDERHLASVDDTAVTVWSGFGGGESQSLGGEHLASISAVVGGFAVVTWPATAEPGEPPLPEPLEVRAIDYFGRTRPLTRLPAGTQATTFAAALVAVPDLR